MPSEYEREFQAELLAQIEARRQDKEFMARIQRMLVENKPILDALAFRDSQPPKEA